jgi:hypothetical protein
MRFRSCYDIIGAGLLGKPIGVQVSCQRINKRAIRVDLAYFIPGFWCNVEDAGEACMENKKMGLTSSLGGTSWHRYRWWRELLERRFEVRLYSSGQVSTYVLSITLLSMSKAAMARILSHLALEQNSAVLE